MADIRPPITTSNIPLGWNRADQFIISLTAVDQAETLLDIPVGVKATYCEVDGADPDLSSPKQETTGYLVTFSTLWTKAGQGIFPIKFFSTDNNGNQEIFKTEYLKLDNVAPETQVAVADPNGADNWYITNPTISLVTFDIGSGVNITRYKWDTALSWTIYSSSFQIPSEGVHTLYYYSDDIAGNVENVKSKSFKYDAVAPETEDDAPSGVQKQAVTVHFFYADNASGVMQTYYTTDGSTPTTSSPSGSSITISDSGTYTLKYFSVDYAGNAESVKQAAVEIFIDTEAPTTYISESGGIFGTHGWWRLTPSITLSATDPSGIKDIYYKLYPVGATTTAKYTSPVDLSATINLSTTYNISLEIDQSGLRVDVDLRGVIPSQTTIVEIINNINTAAAQIIATETNSQGGTGTGYVTLTSTKAGQSNPTAEIKFIQPLTKDGTQLVFGLNTSYPHTYTESVLFVTYTNPFILSSDNQWTIEYYAEDNEGNKGTVASKQYKLDSVVPVTTSHDSIPPDGLNGWYHSIVNITLTALDSLSGVYRTYYQWDNNLPILQYAGENINVPSQGTHILKSWSVDYAGNIEPIVYKTYKYDYSEPITTDDTLNFTGIIITTFANGYQFVTNENPTYLGAYQVQTLNVNVKSVSRFFVIGKGYYNIVSIGGTDLDIINVDPLMPSIASGDTIEIDYYYDHSAEPEMLNTTDFTLVEHTPVYIHDHDITVTLFPYNAYSPVDDTFYSISIDGGTSWTPYVSGTQIALTDSGDYTIRYYSVNDSGLSETPHNARFIVRIDKRLPTVVLTQDVPDGLDNWQISNFKINVDLGSTSTIQRLNRTILPVSNYRVFTAQNDAIDFYWNSNNYSAYLSSVEIILGTNDTLDLRAGGTANQIVVPATNYSVYSPTTSDTTNLVKNIQDDFDGLYGAGVFTLSFNAGTKKYTLESTGPFTLLFDSGIGAASTIANVLGFHKEDKAEFIFTTSGITTLPAIGDHYSNNSSVFAVDYSSLSLIKVHRISGTNDPITSGNLIRVTGIGDYSIAFSACTSSYTSDFEVKTSVSYAATANLVTELKNKLNAAVAIPLKFDVTINPIIPCSYSYIFRIETNDSSTFDLNFLTGPNNSHSAATLLGFSKTDHPTFPDPSSDIYDSDYYRLKLQDKFVKSIENISGITNPVYIDRERGGSGFYDEILVDGILPSSINDINIDYYHFVGIDIVYFQIDAPVIPPTLNFVTIDNDLNKFISIDNINGLSFNTVLLADPSQFYLSTDGIHIVSAKALDMNSVPGTGLTQKTSRQTDLTIKLDRVLPVTIDYVPVTPPWLQAPYTISFNGSDATSGIKDIHYTLDGSIPTLSSPTATPVPSLLPITHQVILTSSFLFSVSGISVLPVIGDQYSNNSSTFQIDAVSYSTFKMHRVAGTNNPIAPGNLTRVTVGGTGDLLIAFSASAGAPYILRYFSQDKAGNQESPSAGKNIHIDGSLPVTTLTTSITPPDGTIFHFYISGTTTLPSAGDQYSNNSSTFQIDYVSASLLKMYRIVGINEPTSLGALTRVAGSGDVSISFSKFDHWFITQPTVTLTGVDTESGLRVIDPTYYRFNPSPTWLIYSGPILLIDGTAIIEYYSIDAAGNFEAYKSTTLKVDSVAPVTTTDIPITPWSARKRVSFIITDATSGGLTTYFTLNGSTPTIASPSGSFIDFNASGIYTIKYRSIDNAGNLEAVNTKTLQLDLDYPVISNLQPIHIVDTKTVEAINIGDTIIKFTTALSSSIVAHAQFTVDAETFYVKTINSSLTQVTVYNAATVGHLSQSVNIYQFRIDLSDTQITFDVSDPSWPNSSGVDINSVIFDVDGIEFSTTKNLSSFSYIGTPGSYTITIAPIQNVLAFEDIKILKIKNVSDLAGS